MKYNLQILYGQFCDCGLPLYLDGTKIICKRHKENIKREPKITRDKEIHGKSNSPNRFYDYE